MPSTGTPESKIACGARGEPCSCTDSGPPERITAFGFMSRNAASAFWNGTISEYTPSSRTRRAISCVTWEPKSTIRILSCAEATCGEGSAAPAAALLGAVMARNYATHRGVASVKSSSIPVIASEAKQSSSWRKRLDCFVARAPRNDGLDRPLPHHGDEKPVGPGAARGHQQALGGLQRGGGEIFSLVAEDGNRLRGRHNRKFRMPRHKGAH